MSNAGTREKSSPLPSPARLSSTLRLRPEGSSPKSGLPAEGADCELRKLQKVKAGSAPPYPALGPEMVSFFKHAVEKRQAKLGKIADCWKVLVPPMLSEHCALEGINRGSLTVVVDCSPHLYELKQLLLAGLEKQLLLACKSAGLRKIVLKAGRWYAGDSPAERKLDFGR